MRLKVILEIGIQISLRTHVFLVYLRDLKFNGGLLRFKVILEIGIRMSLRSYVFLGIYSGSEIERWLVAIQGYSAN